MSTVNQDVLDAVESDLRDAIEASTSESKLFATHRAELAKVQLETALRNYIDVTAQTTRVYANDLVNDAEVNMREFTNQATETAKNIAIQYAQNLVGNAVCCGDQAGGGNGLDMDMLMQALRNLFMDFGTNGGAIFTKYWPVATSPVFPRMDFVDYGTHVLPVGAGGDVTIYFERWPEAGTKFVTIMIHNGGRGVIRWPGTMLWQTRGNVPPVLKENGTDTVVLWRDAEYRSATDSEVVLAARAGR